ncbi:MAG: hypothetical protein SGJ26_05395 [Nitrospirota bacterium]|nr:hypothetical protein [Nitrospirota bacterium]
MRCARCGGLMVLEKFEVFGLGSYGDEFSGWRCINCGGIVDLVIAAHQRIASPAAASLQAVTTVQGSSLSHRRIEQRITTRS